MRQLEFEHPNDPVEEAMVAIFEATIGARLPHSYCEFLQATNGGYPTARNNRFVVSDNCYFDPDVEDIDVQKFYGLTTAVPQRLTLFTVRQYKQHVLPAGTIPIAGDQFGDNYLLGIAEPVRGQIYYWGQMFFRPDTPSDRLEDFPLLANSFEDFIDALVPSES